MFKYSIRIHCQKIWMSLSFYNNNNNTSVSLFQNQLLENFFIKNFSQILIIRIIVHLTQKLKQLAFKNKKLLDQQLNNRYPIFASFIITNRSQVNFIRVSIRFSIFSIYSFSDFLYVLFSLLNNIIHCDVLKNTFNSLYTI